MLWWGVIQENSFLGGLEVPQKFKVVVVKSEFSDSFGYSLACPSRTIIIVLQAHVSLILIVSNHQPTQPIFDQFSIPEEAEK